MTEHATAARHPLRRLGDTIGRLPKYVVLARALLGDPSVSRWRKGALAAGIAYLASPIDLVPGVIPVAGQLDDLAAVLLALRVALGGCSPEAASAHLRAAGLQEGDIGRDLAIVRGATGWLARRAASTTARLGAASARALGRAATLGLAGLRKARKSRARPRG